VIRSEDRVTCIFGDQQSVLVEGRGPGDPGSLAERLPRFDEQLRAYYEFVLLGADRKLKRPAVVLKVKPRDAYRYGYKLWVDRSTAMPLKVQMLGEDGEAVEDFQFTQLELDVEIPDSRLEPSLALDEFTWHHQETGDRQSLDSPAWLAADLPDGFRLELAERRQGPDGDEEILQLIYTDGLASVSVFIEPMVASRKPMGGFSRLGAANAYSTRHTEVQVTAMGEVPRRTVRRIAESVGPAP
jgi:sigma-E factor negative regulatory protein RseB